jgi:hypothetical protein
MIRRNLHTYTDLHADLHQRNLLKRNKVRVSNVSYAGCRSLTGLQIVVEPHTLRITYTLTQLNCFDCHFQALARCRLECKILIGSGFG